MLKITKLDNPEPRTDSVHTEIKRKLFHAPRGQVERMDCWEIDFDYPDLVSEVWVIECSAYMLPKMVPALIHQQMAVAHTVGAMDSLPKLSRQETLEFTKLAMRESVHAILALGDPIFTSGVIKDWLDIMLNIEINEQMEISYTILGKKFPMCGVGIIDVLRREKKNLHTKKYDNLINYIDLPTDLESECDMIAHRTPSPRYAESAGDENYALPA